MNSIHKNAITKAPLLNYQGLKLDRLSLFKLVYLLPPFLKLNRK